jgi:hypothetical protein
MKQKMRLKEAHTSAMLEFCFGAGVGSENPENFIFKNQKITKNATPPRLLIGDPRSYGDSDSSLRGAQPNDWFFPYVDFGPC